MKLLVVCATKKELDFVQLSDKRLQKITWNNQDLDVLITGVGMMATTYWLTETLNNEKYDLVINAGIAGHFSPDIKIGEVVCIEEEQVGDLGAEDDMIFLDVFDLKLADENEMPYKNGVIQNKIIPDFPMLQFIKRVKGLTVNKVHGNERNIEIIINRYHANVETMEGAAVFYVCRLKNIPFLQLRCISNKVEKRNRNNWEINLAIKNLNDFLKNLLDEIF